jgi:hypothetical protein
MANRFSQLATVATVLLLAEVTNLSGGAAIGAGSVDQTLTGNPDCGNDTFQTSAGAIGYLTQEFVPSKGALTGVDVCVMHNGSDKDLAVGISVRKGTANDTGDIIATGYFDLPDYNFQWAHVDFDPVAITPGEKLVIEVDGYFGWSKTCAEVSGPCDHVDPDLYPPGTSIYGDSDFLFRTYGSDEQAPAPGPSPLSLEWGDEDCSGDMNALDALVPLMAAAGISLSPPAGSCPAPGQTVTVMGRQRSWGDVDCLGGDPVLDALAILRDGAGGFDSPRDIGCPLPEERVVVVV